MYPFAKQPMTMKTALIGTSCLTVLLILCFWVSGLRGQVTRTLARTLAPKASAVPKSPTLFPVCDQISIPLTIGNSASFIVNPDGREIDAGDSFLFQVYETSAGGGAKGGGLKVYLQSSCDDGQTWNDVAVAFVPSGATGAFVGAVSTVAAAPTTVTAVQDGTMTEGTDVQGPVGKRFRIRCSYSAAGATAGVWTF